MATIEKVDLNVNVVMRRIVDCFRDIDPSIGNLPTSETKRSGLIDDLADVSPLLPDNLTVLIDRPIKRACPPRVEVANNTTLSCSEIVTDRQKVFTVIPVQRTLHSRYFLQAIMESMLGEKELAILTTEDAKKIWKTVIEGRDRVLMADAISVIVHNNLAVDSRARQDVVGICKDIILYSKNRVRLVD